ncbi:MAG: cyclic nucleotide-binding domain-containing protein [Gammaproteobacteria bacterium]|nr:cyclic nucleotide-binding domain-containing protein [Gammaproteobacteria bacterium]
MNTKIAIVGAGPGGLSAAARAAELGVSHVLLEAAPHLANTIFLYQKGKHVMAEPNLLPLRSPLAFTAGSREQVLQAWENGAQQLGVTHRLGAEVKAIAGERGNFSLTLTSGEIVNAECVVLAIGLQGNLRKMGVPGENLPFIQYQLDDPDEFAGETIVVVGAGDAAIENALALAAQNSVTIINRRDEFSRAKEGNLNGILRAIKDETLQCLYNSSPTQVVVTPTDGEGDGKPCELYLSTAEGEARIPCDRIIARLGATPARQFVESCGIRFPNDSPNAVPAVSAQYESNVPGLYIIGALAGYPLIKQAMNQGHEVVEFILGNPVEPADEPLLREKFKPILEGRSVDQMLDLIKTTIPLFESLTTLQLREFMLDSDILKPAPGAVIFRRNDYSDTFFSVLDGEVNIQANPDAPEQTISLHAGQFFGEMTLISGRRRNSTVLAGPDCVLIVTPRRSMLKLINSVEAVQRLIDEVFLIRAIRAQMAPDISDEDLAEVARTALIERHETGQALFHEGDVGDSLYMIRRGSVTVSRDIGGRDVVLSYLAAGNYVGEMSLLSNIPRSATVRATVATETIRLDGEPFKALMKRHPTVFMALQKTARERAASGAKAQQSEREGGDVISFLVKQGLGEATDVLLIDETLCVHCDNCEKACAETHKGTSRLDRKAGPSFASVHVPTSCRHCEHPHCMKDCPPDAIHRAPNGEVFIADNCIGCGNCERNCPYGVIRMAYVENKRRSGMLSWLLFGLGTAPGQDLSATAHHDPGAAKKAIKCDMCKDLSGGPACVRACPTGAAIRVSPEEFMVLTR